MYLSVIRAKESKPVILRHLVHFSHYPFRHGSGKTLVWISLLVFLTRLKDMTTYSAKKYAEVYLDQIVRLHGVPKTIISDRGAPFIARFWEQL
jgi:hypothetical protein